MDEGAATSEAGATLTRVRAADGTAFALREWMPLGDAKAAVVVAHGLSEHGARYGPFADALVDAGYAVYASDHRGHGATAGDLANAGDVGADGWNATLGDLRAVADIARAAHPAKPIFFFGHSMGSVLAQRFIQTDGDGLAGVVLCGTFGNVDHLDAILGMADAAAAGDAGNERSALQVQMFSGFNAAFEPKTTGFEWLSRDEDQVRRYVDDPYCGFPLTNASLAVVLHGFDETWRTGNEARVRADLPILVIAGAQDPTGAATGSVQRLVDRYRARGVHDLTLTLYPDDRHEILNERDRERVFADVVAWFDAHVPG